MRKRSYRAQSDPIPYSRPTRPRVMSAAPMSAPLPPSNTTFRGYQPHRVSVVPEEPRTTSYNEFLNMSGSSSGFAEIGETNGYDELPVLFNLPPFGSQPADAFEYGKPSFVDFGLFDDRGRKVSVIPVNVLTNTSDQRQSKDSGGVM
jgi:hypothetical protein